MKKILTTIALLASLACIGHSQLVYLLVAAGRLDVKDIEGQWEPYVIEEVDGNLVIAGSDKLGTIYGVYDVSERIGVSPWYWWADVPVVHRDALIAFEACLSQPFIRNCLLCNQIKSSLYGEKQNCDNSLYRLSISSIERPVS